VFFLAYFFETQAWLLGFQSFGWFYYIVGWKFKQWFLGIEKDKKCQIFFYHGKCICVFYLVVLKLGVPCALVCAKIMFKVNSLLQVIVALKARL
jgi:hypothetical protein